MKYCPNCGSEYFDENDLCADCQIGLVSEEIFRNIQDAEEQYKKDLTSFSKVAILENQFIADLVISALGRERIPYIIRTYEDTAYDGIYTLQKGWGALLVPSGFVEQAKSIYEQIQKDVEESSSEDADGDAEKSGGDV